MGGGAEEKGTFEFKLQKNWKFLNFYKYLLKYHIQQLETQSKKKISFLLPKKCFFLTNQCYIYSFLFMYHIYSLQLF